ncbi:MAG: hypothetical protein NTX64_12710, partial [Elusimicrobia bacterium]|nr:hypothetical protein [Elusimicrobiota bacterium]
MRLFAAVVCLLAFSPAHAGSLLEGRVAQIASEAGMAAATPAPLALPGVPAPRGAVFPSESPWIGKPLDPALLSLDGAFTDKSKAEWQARVNANGGKAAIVPLAPIDPTRKLVVFIPGISLNLQDAHEIAVLDGPYQVVIAVYNQRSTLEENSKELADALKALGRYRLAL